MAYILKFPITLRDAGTGTERPPAGDEIDFGIDDAEGLAGDLFSLTEYPRDKDEEGRTAIWFADGAIFVAKMYPNWCPSSMPLCHPTNPILPEVTYRGNVKWRADRAYTTEFNIYLDIDGSIS